VPPTRRLLPTLLLVLAILPAAAFAHSAASASQAKAIRAAAVKAHQLSKRQAACQVVTVSSVDRSYAAMAWPVKLSASCMKVAADGVVLLHESAGSWHVIAVGSDLRCPIKGMPTKVGRDLGVCPKG
jgi:hypothetical protein